MNMTKVKILIQEYDKEKDPFRKLLVIGSIFDELEKTKKELTRKIR